VGTGATRHAVSCSLSPFLSPGDVVVPGILARCLSIFFVPHSPSSLSTKDQNKTLNPLVDYIYSTLNLDLDYILPFAFTNSPLLYSSPPRNPYVALFDEEEIRPTSRSHKRKALSVSSRSLPELTHPESDSESEPEMNESKISGKSLSSSVRAQRHRPRHHPSSSVFMLRG
jgi:hypothetical protein